MIFVNQGSSSFRERRPFFLAAVLVVLLGVWLRLYPPPVLGRTPDEKTYSQFTQQILSLGWFEGVRTNVDTYLNNPNNWVYPPPTRIGYLALCAAWAGLNGSASEESLARLSAAVSMLTLLLTCIFAWRWFGPWAGLVSALVMAILPVELAIARRAWQDGVFTFASLLVVAAGVELVREDQLSRKAFGTLTGRRLIPFLLAAAFIPWIKESAPAIVAVTAALVTVHALRKRRPLIEIGRFLAAVAGTMCLSFFVLACAMGGPAKYLQLYRNAGATHLKNTYGIDFQGGPWYSAFQSLILLNPGSTILWFFSLCILCIALCNWITRGEEPVQIALGLFLFMFVLWICTVFLPYLKNMRYLSPLYAPFALMCGFGVGSVLDALHAASTKTGESSTARLVTLFVCAMLVFAAWTDYDHFRFYFLERDTVDLVNRMLFRLRGWTYDYP